MLMWLLLKSHALEVMLHTGNKTLTLAGALWLQLTQLHSASLTLHRMQTLLQSKLMAKEANFRPKTTSISTLSIFLYTLMHVYLSVSLRLPTLSQLDFFFFCFICNHHELSLSLHCLFPSLRKFQHSDHLFLGCIYSELVLLMDHFLFLAFHGNRGYRITYTDIPTCISTRTTETETKLLKLG